MREKINEEVSVVMYDSARLRAARPHRMSWQDRDHLVNMSGYHRSLWDGRAQHHIYETVMKSVSLWQRLHVNTEQLERRREGSSDGHAA